MQIIRTRLARLVVVSHRESLRAQKTNPGVIRRGPRAPAGSTRFNIHMTFSLDELLKDRLDMLSSAVGISKGTLVRDAIACYLEMAEQEDLSEIPTRLARKRKDSQTIEGAACDDRLPKI